jgi:hypothetical protein
MPNHFEDRHAGEAYDLNGAPVVLVRQHAASWGHTWIVRYVDEDRTFAIEPGGLDLLGWELLGHVVDGVWCPRGNALDTAGVLWDDSEAVTAHRCTFVGWPVGAAEAARINFERADGMMSRNAESALSCAIFGEEPDASAIRFRVARAVRESAWNRLRTLAGRGNVRAKHFFGQGDGWRVLAGESTAEYLGRTARNIYGS